MGSIFFVDIGVRSCKVYCFFLINKILDTFSFSLKKKVINISVAFCSLALPISSVILGQRYAEKCPIEPAIPKLLIIQGYLAIGLISFILLIQIAMLVFGFKMGIMM